MKKDGKAILKDLYSQDFVFADDKGNKFDVPLHGSLGLLAEEKKRIFL